MELFLSIVGAITTVIGLGTALINFRQAWLSLQETRNRVNRDRSNRSRVPSFPGSREDKGFGCKRILVIFVFGLIGLMGLNLFASVTFNSPSVTGTYCCDLGGIPRCPLLAPLPPGSPCFCPYQGSGFTCYQ